VDTTAFKLFRLLFVHCLLIFPEVLDLECLWQYFIEIIVIFHLDLVTLKAVNLDCVIQMQISMAPPVGEVINVLDLWTGRIFVGLRWTP
jgi:hypothetical protein